MENLKQPLHNKNIPNDSREKYLNTIKMLVYLFCGLLKVMDKRMPGSSESNKKSNKEVNNNKNT